jgi:hypothetical protein
MKATRGLWGKLCPLYSFYFHFSNYFFPISYQFRQEADEGDKHVGGDDGEGSVGGRMQ